MLSRAAVGIALGTGFLAFWLFQREPRAQPPPAPQPQRPVELRFVPQFSPWRGKALEDVLALEEGDVTRLERALALDPEDQPTRLKLMAYHLRADRIERPEDREKRARHFFWLLEHHPESEILHSGEASFTRDQLPPADYQRAMDLWRRATNERPGDTSVLWNAASFFRSLDQWQYLTYMEATATADPNHPYALRPLAQLYAMALLNGGPLAARARNALETSGNVWILGNAAYMLRSQYNLSLQTGSPNSRAAELAERYFLRAKALDPGLDRSRILPTLPDPSAAVLDIGAPQSGPPAPAEIRRLTLDEFPELPAPVAAVLRARGCSVPQPGIPGSPRRNVIRGEFFTRGRLGWAVLCAAAGTDSLLVFRDDGDRNPDTLASAAGGSYQQGDAAGRMVYSREITAVGRDYIVQHYRAYGGPQPPPVDHQGIDDAFLEKASVVWYYYQGKWITLQGAD